MPESDYVYFIYWFIFFSIKVIHDLSFKSPVVLKDLLLHWHLGTILWRGAWFHFHFKCKEKDCENGEPASLHTEDQGSGVRALYSSERDMRKESFPETWNALWFLPTQNVISHLFPTSVLWKTEDQIRLELNWWMFLGQLAILKSETFSIQKAGIQILGSWLITALRARGQYTELSFS